MKINEVGRTMAEMLGVISIVGVLSVTGINTITKVKSEHRTTDIVSSINEIVSRAKSVSCKYETDFKTYTRFMNKSNQTPNGMEYIKDASGGKNSYFEDKYGLAYSIEPTCESEQNISRQSFIVQIGPMSEEDCLVVATTKYSSGNMFKGIAVKSNKNLQASDFGKSNTTASTKCVAGNVNYVYLMFSGCR